MGCERGAVPLSWGLTQMSLPNEKTAKQKAAAKSRADAVVVARLLAVSRSLSDREVIILHTSEGVLHLTASAPLWASLRGLLCPKPFSSPGRPAGIKNGAGGYRDRPKGVGLNLSPEARAALVAQIADVRAGVRTHQAAADILGITRSSFTKWLGRMPA